MLAVLRPGSLASVAFIALGFAAGCVAPGSGETGPPGGIVAAFSCEGEAPACVMGCSARAFLSRARCEDGIWHCEHGVRTDLCCDPIYAPEHCPAWGDICDGYEPCADGYTCVSSRSWPLPAQEGVCRLGDWSIPEPLESCSRDDVLQGHRLFELGPAAVKLEGVVIVEPLCDGRRCTADNPCCQRCTGSYAFDVAEPGAAPLEVPLRTETLSCAGSNCGFTCAPLQPGRRYRIWGLWVPDAGGATPGALYVAGSCAD